MKKILLTLLAIALAFVAQSQQYYSLDFEQSNLSQWGFQVREYPSNRTDAMSRSSFWSADGSYSCYFYLDHNDANAQYGNVRTEGTMHNYASSNSNYRTDLRWWTWHWYFPTATTSMSSTKEKVIAQWHDKAISGGCSMSPFLAIEIVNGRLRGRVRYNLTATNYCNNTGAAVEVPAIDLGPVPLDQDVKVVVFYEPSVSNGKCKIWINDVLKMDYNGPNFANGAYFPYFKWGIYAWVWDGSKTEPCCSPLAFYGDRLKIYGATSTYEQVANITNNPPVVSAGEAKVVSAATTSTTLDGTATAANGIATRTWSVVSGPNTPTFSPNATTEDPTVAGLIPGLYTFKYRVVDNQSLATEATTTVRVNIPPAVDLSANTGLSGLPGTTVSLNLTSSVTDSDGTITGRLWEQVSGPAGKTATITGSTTSTPTVSNLSSGTWVFRLTATDNNGDQGTGEVTIVILPMNIITVTGSGYKSVKLQ